MKILITATVQSHICQFHKNLILELRKNGIEVHVAARNNLAEKNGLTLDFADRVFDIPFVRSPFKLIANIKAYYALKNLIKKEHYDIIHCNTPMGGVITRLVARKYRSIGTKVIYMAHGFHFFKGAPIKNWMFYYPVEKLLSHITDYLITINQEDYQLAQKSMSAQQVIYVPGVGVDVKNFSDCDIDIDKKRTEIGVPQGYHWLLSVGELLPDKNHEVVLKAIAEIPNVFYTIAGNGKLDVKLQKLAQKLKIADRFKLLGYRRDVKELCKAADIFVFPSKFEGLPVALMEAMASGLPIACSKVRGCADLIDDNGGVLFNPYNIDQIREAINKIMASDTIAMKSYNKEKIKQFSKETVAEKFRNIYSDAIKNS